MTMLSWYAAAGYYYEAPHDILLGSILRYPLFSRPRDIHIQVFPCPGKGVGSGTGSILWLFLSNAAHLDLLQC